MHGTIIYTSQDRNSNLSIYKQIMDEAVVYIYMCMCVSDTQGNTTQS